LIFLAQELRQKHGFSKAGSKDTRHAPNRQQSERDPNAIARRGDEDRDEDTPEQSYEFQG